MLAWFEPAAIKAVLKTFKIVLKRCRFKSDMNSFNMDTKALIYATGTTAA